MEAVTYSVCEECGVEVDPTHPDVVRAFEQKVIRAMGIGKQRIDGLPVLFHRDCFREGNGYRLDRD
jgi:hypothetical protein